MGANEQAVVMAHTQKYDHAKTYIYENVVNSQTYQ